MTPLPLALPLPFVWQDWARQYFPEHGYLDQQHDFETGETRVRWRARLHEEESVQVSAEIVGPMVRLVNWSIG